MAINEEALPLGDAEKKVYEIKSAFARIRTSENDDNYSRSSHTADMTDNVSRHELDAKLETIEARMDGRVASIKNDIQVFLAAQQERDKRLDEQFASTNRDMSRLGNMKANIWGAMVTTIVILVAIGALTIGAFQAGAAKPTAPITTTAPVETSVPPAE